jgi:2-polyprenyl-3-methyl-5-hydroxy-6-metoxy-1,4-benzoquinol methylase
MSTTGTTVGHAVNPGMIFEIFNAYQRTAALKAAIELDLFTQIGKGSHTVEAIAKAIGASPANNGRAVRILCDFLAIMGLLAKEGEEYSLGIEARLFLDCNSPGYFGGAARFLLDPAITSPFNDLAQIVRTGRTTLPDEGTVSYDNPVWVEFAEAMAPMQFMPANEIAAIVSSDQELKVLDIAAGHGLFGIMIAQQNPKAQVTALDWANVLAVAARNAERLGVADRLTLLPGDAFTLDFGGPYDLILVTNFFHHFDVPTCEGLIEKVSKSLKSGGKCLTLDFVPNDDRVSPPAAASFAMQMLGGTPSGDAYTLAQYTKMFEKARFSSSVTHTLEKSPCTLIVSTKA